LFNQTNVGVIGWTNFQFIVTAGTTNTLLQFGFRDDPWALGLDDIIVQPILPPLFQTAVGKNGMMKLTWGAVTGLLYQIQYKTNLFESNWHNLGSPIAATNLSMTTSDLTTGPQRFYRIVWSP
jgi:hypothetical protein